MRDWVWFHKWQDKRSFGVNCKGVECRKCGERKVVEVGCTMPSRLNEAYEWRDEEPPGR